MHYWRVQVAGLVGRTTESRAYLFPRELYQTRESAMTQGLIRFRTRFPNTSSPDVRCQPDFLDEIVTIPEPAAAYALGI